MFRDRTVRMPMLPVLVLVAVVCLPCLPPPHAAGADAPAGPAAELRATMDRAKKLGAKGQLPVAWLQNSRKPQSTLVTSQGASAHSPSTHAEPG